MNQLRQALRNLTTKSVQSDGNANRLQDRSIFQAPVDLMDVSDPNSMTATVAAFARKPCGDRIRDAIIAFTIAERRANFSYLARYNHTYMEGEELVITPAAPIKLPKECSAVDVTGCRWYDFHQYLSNIIDTVPLRLNAPTTADAIKDDEIVNGNLQVLDLDDTYMWIDIRDWMRKKYEWHDSYEQSNFRELMIEEQARWWRMNGKVFPIMHLPGELREAIYVATVGEIILPRLYVTKKKRLAVNFGNGHTHYDKDRFGAGMDPDVQKPNLGLLLVSRQVHNEVKHAIWKGTTKRFRKTSPCDNAADSLAINIKHLAPPLTLTNVQLEMSALCYFHLVGIRTTNIMPIAQFPAADGAFHISTLKKMKALKKLDFRFISSKHQDAICPWSALATNVPWPHSCQRIWIHWFLTFAFEKLRDSGIYITMSGCVKDSTRAFWEGVFAREKRGAKFNVDALIHNICMAKNDFAPIPCECTIPCYLTEEWNPDTILRGVQTNRVVGLSAMVDQMYWSFDG